MNTMRKGVLSLAVFMAAFFDWNGAFAQKMTAFEKWEKKELEKALGGSYVYTIEMPGFDKQEMGGKNAMVFEDNSIKVGFVFEQKMLSFGITNLTGKVTTIHWEQASLAIDNKSKRVLHMGILYRNRDQPQSPTTIPPHGNISDFVLPASNLYVTQRGNMEIIDLLPTRDMNKQQWQDLIFAHKNTEITFFLPVDFDGQKTNYLFKFRITDVRKL